MDKEKNGARLAVSLLFMLIGAAMGSYFSSAAGNGRSFLFAHSSGGTVAAEAALLVLIFLCGRSPGGSLITLFLLAVKGFLISAPVTLYIITNGTSSYPALGLRFCGGFLSAL